MGLLHCRWILCQLSYEILAIEAQIKKKKNLLDGFSFISTAHSRRGISVQGPWYKDAGIMVDVLDFWVPHCLTDTVSTFSIVDFSFFIFLNLMLLSSVSEWRILPVELIAKDASDVLIMSTKVCVSALLDLRWGVCVCVCVCVCAQLCPTLCDPVDSCLSGSSVSGIFQARILELYYYISKLSTHYNLP